MPMKLPVSLFDLQGICFAILMVSLSIVFLKAAGLVTGQLAGLAILISYLLNINFSVIFFLINLPFLWLSIVMHGWAFTVRTIVLVCGISICAPLLSRYVIFDTLHPAVAALLAGACCGVGIIAAFRHNGACGGFGVLALIVEKKWSIKAGWLQVYLDAGIFLAASFVLSFDKVIYSFFAAMIINMLIAWNFSIDQTSAPKTVGS